MMLEGQDVPKTRVVVHRRDWTTLPRLTEIEPGAMLAATRASARVTGRTLQSVSFCENVKPSGDADALA